MSLEHAARVLDLHVKVAVRLTLRDNVVACLKNLGCSQTKGGHSPSIVEAQDMVAARAVEWLF